MKRTINKIATGIAVVVMLTGILRAGSPFEEAGTSASAFLKLGSGAPEAQALGNAYTALGEGVQALFWNPAGAAVATSREVQVSYMQWFAGVGDSAVGYIQPIGRTMIGITARYMRASASAFDLRDDQGIPINWSGDIMQTFVGSVSLARSFFGVLDLGATARYINENNADVRNVNAAFDAGGRIRLLKNKIILGAMGQNLGDKVEVPTALRGGLAFNTKYITLAGEVVDYADDKIRYGVGLAVHIPEDVVQVARFDLRVGYYNRESTGWAEKDSMGDKLGLETTSKITLGFGFYSSEVFGYGLGLDYAMMPSGALGTAHQLAVRLQF